MILYILPKNDWSDIRKTIVLSAAQLKIHKECFKPDFNQDRWDIILQKTDEANKDLLDKVIDKMLIVL